MDDYPLWSNIDVIVEAHASGTGAEPPHSYAFTRCITKKVLRRTHDHVLELINNGTIARGTLLVTMVRVVLIILGALLAMSLPFDYRVAAFEQFTNFTNGTREPFRASPSARALPREPSPARRHAARAAKGTPKAAASRRCWDSGCCRCRRSCHRRSRHRHHHRHRRHHRCRRSRLRRHCCRLCRLRLGHSRRHRQRSPPLPSPPDSRCCCCCRCYRHSYHHRSRHRHR